MPVTNYYTANGSIIGESTGGVRTDYMVDALGSVTGTVNQLAQVLNTYRYKPYGALLAKTGASADPKMQWVGSLGYRATARRQIDYYVRARHYGAGSGAWATADPLWPEARAYVYVRGGAPSRVDPTGSYIKYPQGDGPCGDEVWGAGQGKDSSNVKKCYDDWVTAFNKVKHDTVKRAELKKCVDKYPGAPSNLIDLYIEAFTSFTSNARNCVFCEGGGPTGYGNLPDACKYLTEACDWANGRYWEAGNTCPPTGEPEVPDEKKCFAALIAMGCTCGTIICANYVKPGDMAGTSGCCNYTPLHEITHCVTGWPHPRDPVTHQVKNQLDDPDWLTKVSRCVCMAMLGADKCECPPGHSEV